MGVYSIQGKTLAFSRAVLNVFFSDAQWKPDIYVIQIDLANFLSRQAADFFLQIGINFLCLLFFIWLSDFFS